MAEILSKFISPSSHDHIPLGKSLALSQVVYQPSCVSGLKMMASRGVRRSWEGRVFDHGSCVILIGERRTRWHTLLPGPASERRTPRVWTCARWIVSIRQRVEPMKMADRRTYDEVPQLYIDPTECIDCGACVPVCPVRAI